jgi:hypothetical protein
MVRVDAGVRLRVGVLAPEERTGVFRSQGLDRVDVLAAGIEAVADGALGVLVTQPGAHREQHGGGGVVLTRDELQGSALVVELRTGGLGDSRLDRGDHLQSRPVGGARSAGQFRVRHAAQPNAGGESGSPS